MASLHRCGTKWMPTRCLVFFARPIAVAHAWTSRSRELLCIAADADTGGAAATAQQLGHQP